MRYLILLFFFNLVFSLLSAQDNESEIKNTVNSLFHSMKSSDGQGILSSFDSGATLKSVLKDSAGSTILKDEVISDFASSIAKLPKGYADERITFELIKIDGDLAFVWAPYELYIGGKFKHCGVDAFTLVRKNNQWKITSLIDTRRKIGCKVN